MCRNIKTLFNFDPPATDEETKQAALQYVRKLTGFTKPTRQNEEAFYEAVAAIAMASGKLLSSLSTTAAPRNREAEALWAAARAAKRYGSR